MTSDPVDRSRSVQSRGETVPITAESLIRAEDRLRNVIDGAKVGTWSWDFDTVTQLVNDIWASMLGYDLAEMQPITYDTWDALVHPDDHAAVDAELNRCLTGEIPAYEAEYRMRHRAGHWIWVLDRGRVVQRKPDGSPKLMAGIQIEISELKSREAALIRAKADLEAALADRASAERRFFDIASVSDGLFWEMDDQQRFSYISRPELFGGAINPNGKTRAEVLGRMPEVLNSAEWSLVLAAQAEHKPFRNFVFLAPGSTPGNERWLSISGTPVVDKEGNFAGYRGVGSDVTELYLAKARAEEASRTKSIFLANMSHEIRTPLNGVLGMAEVLETALTDPDHKRMIGTIRRSGETLLNILNDVLDMSKIEAGKLNLETVSFNPAELASGIEELFTPRADEKNLEFEVLISSGADQPRLGDPFRVQQILHNLVSNAIKFTDQGSVTVTLSGRGNSPLVIEVSDTGIGMTAEQIARVHEEFTQADLSVTRRFGGTGLGMTITHNLVERMGGTVQVASAIGHGTTITVSLPLAVAQRPAPQPVGGAVGADDLAGLSLLVADDNGTNRTVIELMLGRAGARVTTVCDGAQAVAAAQAARFDVILLDIAMPVMDGAAALNEIRRIEGAQALPRVPIIAVTANAMAHQVSEYLVAGFDACLSKPINMAETVKLIRGLCPAK